MREILIGVARRGETITYEELEAEMKRVHGSCSPHWRLGSHLGRISHHERWQGRPLLSAVVVNRDGSVGPGFWKMVEDEMRVPVLGREQFYANTLSVVYAYWGFVTGPVQWKEGAA